jgi:hypothetical protein
MAGIAELYQVASAMQRDKLAADPLYSGTKAFGEGLSSGFKKGGTQGTKGIEQALKLMELSSKMKEYKQKQEMYNLTRDVLKANGIIPYDEDEKLVARDEAFEDTSTGTVDPSAGVKTEAGKVTQLVNKAQKMSGGDYEIVLGGSIADPKMNIKHIKGEKATDRKRIDALAEKMAKRAYAEKVYESAGGRENVGFMDADKLGKYIPTPSEMDKYRPLAQAYLSGKEPEKADPRKSLKEKDGKKDSVAGIGDLPGVEDLWDLLK